MCFIIISLLKQKFKNAAKLFTLSSPASSSRSSNITESVACNSKIVNQRIPREAPVRKKNDKTVVPFFGPIVSEYIFNVALTWWALDLKKLAL